MDVDLSMDFEKDIPTNAPTELKALTEKALEANKAHQYALTKYAERLAAELQEMENLMDAVTTDDIDDERDVEVHIPGATKAMGPCPMSEFLNPNSPFFEHASRRSRYMSYTVDHPMKNRELDVLAEAVKAENLRLQAYESQKSGQDGAKIIDLEINTEGINWNNVAEKVSIACTVKRTADQCRIRWLGDRHPNINHSNWTSSELDKLKTIVSAQLETNDGKVDWVHVSKDLGTNRTPIDCMRRGIPRQRHIWHPEADEKLTEAVKLYGTDNWGIVARFVSEDATASQCSGRYSRAIDLSRKRGPWTNDEYERLKVAVAAYGNSWVEVAACIPGRTNEQCRERWTEHINQASATILWSEVEDQALLDAVATMGNRWTAISTKIGNGSTGQQCRARWEKLKRLQDLRKAAAAGPSSSQIVPPKPSCRPRKDAAPGSANSTGGPTAPFTKEISPCPVGKKGKGKERATEPPSDLASDAPAAATPSKTPSRHVLMPENDTTGPNKRAAGDATDQAPAAKKRKIATRSKDTTCSIATKSPASSLSTPSTRTSSRKKVADVNEPAPTRPQPRPRGRPKKAVLRPSSELISDPPAADASSRTHVPRTPDRSSSPLQAANSDAEAAESSRPKPRPRGRPRKAPPEPGPPEPEAEPDHEHECDASSTLSGVLTPALSKVGTGSLIGSTLSGRGRGRGRGRGGGQGAAAHANTNTPGRRQSARVAALQHPMAESSDGDQEDKRS